MHDIAVRISHAGHPFAPTVTTTAGPSGGNVSRVEDAVLATVGAREAIGAVTRRAIADRPDARTRWTAATGADPSVDWVVRLRSAGRLTLNFHPDRIARDGRTVAAALATDGVYLSQWVTGISAGSRSAVPGGERQRFERQLFAGAYDDADPTSGAHPVYGSFDLLSDEHGGSPRFGSGFVVVRSHVRERTTLCVGDSHIGPRDVGTFDEPWSLLAGLGEQASQTELLSALEDGARSSRASRELDGYVEIQVHGGVSLADDVEAIVLDPSFRGTDVEREISRAAERFGFDVAWHRGSELAVDAVPDDFRGPTMPTLARAVAGADAIVHARAIGIAAAREVFEDPNPAGDSPETALQQLKYLWHTVLAHGRDATAP